MAGRVIYLNPAFTRVFGWRPEECLNRTIDFVPEENRPETLKFMAQIQQGVSFSGVETKRYTKSGQLVDVSISGAVFFDPDNNPEGSSIPCRISANGEKKTKNCAISPTTTTSPGCPTANHFICAWRICFNNPAAGIQTAPGR
jgi:PAS domain S-box-containing protein